MGIPDHIICLLINLYAGQKPTVRTGHGTMDWFKTGKGVQQGCILSPACTCMLSRVRLLVTLWTVAHWTPLSMGFWGKYTGVGCHLLLQRIFWFQELNPYLLCLQHWQADFFYHWATWDATSEEPPHQKKKKKKKKKPWALKVHGRICTPAGPMSCWAWSARLTPTHSHSDLSSVPWTPRLSLPLDRGLCCPFILVPVTRSAHGGPLIIRRSPPPSC